MESLINEKSIDDIHQQALEENEALRKSKNSDVKPEVIRIDIPVEQMMDANRSQKKAFFKQLAKSVNARVELIRLKRRLKQ